MRNKVIGILFIFAAILGNLEINGEANTGSNRHQLIKAGSSKFKEYYKKA